MTGPDVHSHPVQVKWPGVLSAQAQAELTQLLTECAEACRNMLQSFHPCRPFSLARRRRGGLSFCGGDFMPDAVDDPISYLYGMFVGKSAYYTALAVVHDVQTDDDTVMRIYAEHVDGEASGSGFHGVGLETTTYACDSRLSSRPNH